MTQTATGQSAPSLARALAPHVVRAAALWVLVVSTIKMTKGSPGALPLIIRENPLGEDLTFSLTLMVEIGFSLAALLSPRIGWWLMSALLTVFLAVLFHLIWIGATSCGCFGGAVKFSPYQMLAVDGTCFALLMWTRKASWSSTARIAWLPTLVAAALGFAAPWVLIDNAGGAAAPKPTAPEQASANSAASNTTATSPAAESASGSTSSTTPESSEPANASAESTPAPAAPPTNAAWSLPATKPRWAKLRPPEWLGSSIHDTELGVWLDTRSQLDTANWILYLETCTHCRNFLNAAAGAWANDPKAYVFVRLATEQDEAEGIIQEKPPGETAALPNDIQWVVGPELPPWELVLENGVVIEAIHHDVSESGLDERKSWRLENGVVVETSESFQY